MIIDDDGQSGEYASPPCFAHELAEGFDGCFTVVDAEQRRDVARWRKTERQRLIALRMSFVPEERRVWSQAIAAGVADLAGHFAGKVVSFYWPFRGEPDLRPLMEVVLSQGGTVALPIVVEKARPLAFRSWRPGEELEKGVWDIPVPKAGRSVVPDVVLAPVVGFDAGCYRLGYGGGFFDRTLAAMASKPQAIGVGYACARIATIFAQPHDIAMDAIVTPDEVVLPDRGA